MMTKYVSLVPHEGEYVIVIDKEMLQLAGLDDDVSFEVVVEKDNRLTIKSLKNQKHTTEK